MALTDAAVKALQARSVRYMKSDGSGLYLEVLPSGEKSWLYRYRFGGKPEKIALGRYPVMGGKVARDRRDDMRRLVRDGISPVQQRRQARAQAETALTVRDFGDRYFREQVKSRWKNPATIRRYLDKEIYPALGNVALKNVTADDVRTLVYRKRDNGHVAAAIQLRCVIKWLFDYAVETCVVDANPATKVARKYIGKAPRRSRVLNAKEIRGFLRTLYRSNIRRQFKLALHILLLTLVRKSELLLARWDHIDFDAREWLIPSEDSKNGKEHIVYLSHQVVDLFRELHALAGTSELVLPGRGSTTKPFAKNALNKAMEGLRFCLEPPDAKDGKSVELNPFTIHDLRRTGATLLTERGFNKEVIEKALNHEPAGIRAVYILAEFAEERRKMLQWWSNYVDGLVNETKVLFGNFGGRG